jgi:hypothetical protein
MTLAEIFSDYKQMLENQLNLALIEKFYDDNIAQIENNDDPIMGKDLLQQMEGKNLERFKVLKQQLNFFEVDEDAGKVSGEMEIDFETKSKNRKRLREEFVQHWKDGKIIFQAFTYGGILDVA